MRTPALTQLLQVPEIGGPFILRTYRSRPYALGGMHCPWPRTYGIHIPSAQIQPSWFSWSLFFRQLHTYAYILGTETVYSLRRVAWGRRYGKHYGGAGATTRLDLEYDTGLSVSRWVL